MNHWVVPAMVLALASGCVGQAGGYTTEQNESDEAENAGGEGSALPPEEAAGEDLASQGGGSGGRGGEGGAGQAPEGPGEDPAEGAETGGGTFDDPPPAGSVPVVVALGDGGFTLASCDGGRTWNNRQQFSSERGDHSQWTAFGGLSFGKGRVVAGLGWGTAGHIITSATGADFTEVPDKNFLRGTMVQGLNDSIGGVAFTGQEFVVFSRYVWRSQDGVQWMAGSGGLPRGAEQLRQLRAFPHAKLIVAAVENQSGSGHTRGNFVIVSSDGGNTWQEGTGFNPGCAGFMQHSGDIAMAGDVIVVAAEQVCRSGDRGRTWKNLARPTGTSVSSVFSDGKGFFALSGGRFYQAPDGEKWVQLSAPPGGADLGAAVAGGFAVMKRDARNILHSQDGKVWTKAQSVDTGSQSLRDLSVGYAQPSGMCVPAARP